MLGIRIVCRFLECFRRTTTLVFFLLLYTRILMPVASFRMQIFAGSFIFINSKGLRMLRGVLFMYVRFGYHGLRIQCLCHTIFWSEPKKCFVINFHFDEKFLDQFKSDKSRVMRPVYDEHSHSRQGECLIKCLFDLC